MTLASFVINKMFGRWRANKSLFGQTTALVIVDMQPTFESANCDKTAGRIKNLIVSAKKEKSKIIILEYQGHSETRPDIIAKIGEYEYTVLTKTTDSGAKEVMSVSNGTLKRAVLCGVNFGACVYRTAVDLKQSDLEVKVVEKACNQPNWIQGWNFYRDLFVKNVDQNALI